MKYRIKKEKRQEALDLILQRHIVQKAGRVKTLVYEQKPMDTGQWTRYFSMDEMDYFLEPLDLDVKDNFKLVKKGIIDEEIENPVEEPTQEEIEDYYGI